MYVDMYACAHTHLYPTICMHACDVDACVRPAPETRTGLAGRALLAMGSVLLRRSGQQHVRDSQHRDRTELVCPGPEWVCLPFQSLRTLLWPERAAQCAAASGPRTSIHVHGRRRQRRGHRRGACERKEHQQRRACRVLAALQSSVSGSAAAGEDGHGHLSIPGRACVNGTVGCWCGKDRLGSKLL